MEPEWEEKQQDSRRGLCVPKPAPAPPWADAAGLRVSHDAGVLLKIPRAWPEMIRRSSAASQKSLRNPSSQPAATTTQVRGNQDSYLERRASTGGA